MFTKKKRIDIYGTLEFPLAIGCAAFIKKQEGLGAIVVADQRVEPEEHKKFVAQEIETWGKVIKANGQFAD